MRDDKLHMFSRVHLRHEIDMCRKTASLLAGGAADGVLNNMLVDSYAIHLRALTEFLYIPRSKPDDLRAVDFVKAHEPWLRARGSMPKALKDAQERAHKQVAHFTKKRFAAWGGDPSACRGVAVVRAIRRLCYQRGRIGIVPAVLFAILSVATSEATADPASLLSCSLMKRAKSAYWYKEKTWAGDDPEAGRAAGPRKFIETDPGQAQAWQPVGFLFSRLDEERVVVKQLYANGTSGEELPGRALHRARDTVLIVWPLPLMNEIRFALINVEERKAVISQLGAGLFALEVSALLADCK